MNLHQMKYLIEIEKQGSITKAAQALFISQPSLSNSIKSLENELGFTIFLRTKSGISLTQKGQAVLKFANAIVSQMDILYQNLSDTSSSFFRLSTENYSFCMRAFVKLCKSSERYHTLNFSLNNVPLAGVIEDVTKFNSDLGILLINKTSEELCQKILGEKNLAFVPLYRLSVNINLREHHPLSGIDPFPFEKLSQYMFVKYSEGQNSDLSYMPELKHLNIINPDKTISVSDRDLKCNIISETDAFGVGCTLHPEFMSHYRIISVPIPNNYAVLGYIYIKNSRLSKEAKQFISLLTDELAAFSRKSPQYVSEIETGA